MDKDYLIHQLMDIAKRNNIELSKDIFEKIINISVFRVVKKGEILRQIEDENKTAALVLNGMCRAYYIDGNGNDITRGFSIAGTLCMDDGLFGYSKSIVTWEAIEESTMIIFDVVEMKKIIMEDDGFKNTYIMLLENAIRYKIYRENDFLVENATERYIHFKKLYPIICECVKQHHLASYLGIAPESLSRIRKALRELN